MKKCFILFAMLVLAYLNLCAEAHRCSKYHETFYDSDSSEEFIPYWFDHIEFADGLPFMLNQEFLKEHGGRAGKLVYWTGSKANIGCS